MKASRIVFLTSSTHLAGTYFRAFFLGKYLAKEGHEVSLIVSSGKPVLKATRKLVDGIHVFSLPSLLASDVNLLHRQLTRIPASLTHTLFNCMLEIVSNADILHSFDVVAPQNATPTLFSRILRFLRIHDRRIFVDWDELYGRVGMFRLGYRGVYSLAGPLLTFLEEKVPQFADGVTVPSEALAQYALSAGVKSEDLFVIPDGSNVDFIKPLDMYETREKLDLPTKKIIYSHFGFLDIEALKILMMAHKKVVRCCPSAILMLVGLGENQIRFVKSFNSTGNVVCVGWQPYHKYPLYLSASDMLLLPLQDNLRNRARWPLRLGDYIAAGRPVIATDLPGIAKVVHNCGLLAKPGDAKDFACKILKIIEDIDLSKEMGKRAREIAETKHSWQIVAKQLEKVYHGYL